MNGTGGRLGPGSEIRREKKTASVASIASEDHTPGPEPADPAAARPRRSRSATGGLRRNRRRRDRLRGALSARTGDVTKRRPPGRGRGRGRQRALRTAVAAAIHGATNATGR